MNVVGVVVAGLTLAAPASKPAAPAARSHEAAGACSIVGAFGGTAARNGKVTMTNTGKAGAGQFALVITLPNGMTTNIRGNYTRSGDQLKMTNTFAAPARVYGCIGMPSTYQISFSPDCAHLTFHKVEDACPGRMMDADGKTLVRQ